MSPFWMLLELRMMEVVSGDNWSRKTCKAPAKLSPPTQTPSFFTGRMPFLSPNQQYQSTEGKTSIQENLNKNPLSVRINSVVGNFHLCRIPLAHSNNVLLICLNFQHHDELSSADHVLSTLSCFSSIFFTLM